MRLSDLNWMDVQEYLKQDDRLILILGACEQHGYLSLMTDILIPQAIADAVSQVSGVIIAPALNFGISPYFLSYPGTVSLRVDTFLKVIEDIVHSFYAQGFRRLLVLNGHGGNAAGKSILAELANELPALRIRWYEWWISESVTTVTDKHGLKSYHAAWIEAFPFVRVADVPERKKDPVKPLDILDSKSARQVYGDGVFGGPYLASSQVMDEVLQAAISDSLELIKFA